MKKEAIAKIELKHKRYLAYLQGIFAISLGFTAAHFTKPQILLDIFNIKLDLIEAALLILALGWFSLHFALIASENHLFAKA
jgi:hypothetical protein